MDGERGDMPGKEELPILRLDAPVYGPLAHRHFLSYLLYSFNLFLFLLHSVQRVLLLPSALVLSLSSQSVHVSACVCGASARTGMLLCGESALGCRGAPNHVLAWTLNKLIFYGCTALPSLLLLKGLQPFPAAFDLASTRSELCVHMCPWEHTVERLSDAASLRGLDMCSSGAEDPRRQLIEGWKGTGTGECRCFPH